MRNRVHWLKNNSIKNYIFEYVCSVNQNFGCVPVIEEGIKKPLFYQFLFIFVYATNLMNENHVIRERMSSAINALCISPDGQSVVIAGRESE